MTDNQQKWIWVIAFVVIPLILVHLFPTSYVSRLVAVVWIYTFVPLIIFILSLFTKQTIKLKNYSNPIVEKRISLIARGFGVVLSLAIAFYITLPIWIGTYNLYIRHQSMEIVQDSVANQSTAVLAPGLYLGLTLSHDPDQSYAYYFPTKYNFGDSQYKLMILPGTSVVLNIEQLHE